MLLHGHGHAPHNKKYKKYIKSNKTFCINNPLPSFIGDMGFPDGFAASYSAVGCHLRSVDVHVIKGLSFKGNLNFWGLKVEAEVQYSLGPPNSFYTKLRLPVVKLFGGALFMSS